VNDDEFIKKQLETLERLRQETESMRKFTCAGVLVIATMYSLILLSVLGAEAIAVIIAIALISLAFVLWILRW